VNNALIRVLTITTAASAAVYAHYTGQPVLASTQLRTGGSCWEQIFTACMPLLMATSTFGLERRSWSSPQWCYLHRLHPMAFLMHTIENEKKTVMAEWS